MNKDTQEAGQEVSIARIYELGYHFVPTLSDEKVPSSVETIKAEIAKFGGEVIQEGAPKFTELAYPISKITNNKKETYSTSYFGWIKFTDPSEGIIGFDKWCKENENMIRFLIISTVKENTFAKKGLTGESTGRKYKATPTYTAVEEKKTELDTEALDRELESIDSNPESTYEVDKK